MELLVLLIFSVSNIVCFMIGAKVGQKVSKDEPIELPKLNPMEAIRERQSRREAEREQNRMEAILRNIDTYDGTSKGQEEVKE